MKQMIALLFFCLAGTVPSFAQPSISNIRLIPGGIEVVERENAATAAFDPGQRLKHEDQRVLIDFMDLAGSPRAGKLKMDPKTSSQEGPVEVGREKALFLYSSRVEKTGTNQFRFTFRIWREQPENVKETFVSLRLNRALQDVPLTVENSEGKFWNSKLIFSSKTPGRLDLVKRGETEGAFHSDSAASRRAGRPRGDGSGDGVQIRAEHGESQAVSGSGKHKRNRSGTDNLLRTLSHGISEFEAAHEHGLP